MTLKQMYLDPEGCSMGGHISPVLDMPQVAVSQRHLDGCIDAVGHTIHIPGVDPDGPAQAGGTAHKLRNDQHGSLLLC